MRSVPAGLPTRDVCEGQRASPDPNPAGKGLSTVRGQPSPPHRPLRTRPWGHAWEHPAWSAARTALLGSHRCRIREIDLIVYLFIYFSPRTMSPEAQRAELGAPPGPERGRSGAEAPRSPSRPRLPPGKLGERQRLPQGKQHLVFLRSWRVLVESFISTCTINGIGGGAGGQSVPQQRERELRRAPEKRGCSPAKCAMRRIILFLS